MCIEAVEVDIWTLGNVPDCFKTLEMRNIAVAKDSVSLQYVPDWFVT